MNAKPKFRPRNQIIWPVAGVIVAIFAAITPSTTEITLKTAVVAWCVAMILVFFLSANPVGARIAVVVAGLFFAVPGSAPAAPLFRFMVLGWMCLPFVAATALVLAPPIPGLRARLAYLFTWGGTRQVARRAPGFDAAASVQFIVATAFLAASLTVVIATPDLGGWRFPVRWLACGIAIMAFGEMLTASLPLIAAAFGLTLPPLMRSPWRSASIGEFWAERWNLFVSALFRKCCYAPLARRGPALALFATFLVSGIAHALMAVAVLGDLRLALMFGSFFLLQPLLIAAERRLHVRRWPVAAGRIWTLALLAITSPLFVEPMFQIIERSWGDPDNALFPVIFVLGLVITLSVLIALASLATRPAAAKVYPEWKITPPA